MGARHAFALQAKPGAQSAAKRHEVLQPPPEPASPASRHKKLPGQDCALAGAQAPAPLQLFWVSVAPAQLRGQAVSSPGNEQAPSWSQSLAAQSGSAASQASLQQLPRPVVPQIPEAHAPSELQGSPATSRAIPPVVPLVTPLLVDFPVAPPQALASTSARPATLIARARKQDYGAVQLRLDR
jgi:hypothetical protein